MAKCGVPLQQGAEIPFDYEGKIKSCPHGNPPDSVSSDTASNGGIERHEGKRLTPSASDRLLHSSEMEESLQGYRVLSEGGKHLGELNPENAHLPVVVNQPLETPEANHSTPVVCDPPEIVQGRGTIQSQTSTDHRRSGFWNGLIACLHPVVGLFNKDGDVSEKKDSWNILFSDIRELGFIGSGSQGAVFVGEYKGEKIAVKKVKDPGYCDGILHLRKLSHPNIVQFK